jgi:methyl-accepting chemotaxis protein
MNNKSLLYIATFLAILIFISNVLFDDFVLLNTMQITLISVLVFLIFKIDSVTLQYPNKSSVDDNLIHSVIFELQQFINQEINIIDNELSRTNTLVKEAVIGISDSFKSLQGLSENQQDIIKLLINYSNNNDIENSISSEYFVQDSNTTLDNFVTSIVNTSKKGIETIDFTDDVVRKLDSTFHFISKITELSNKTEKLAMDALLKGQDNEKKSEDFMLIANEVNSLSMSIKKYNEDICNELNEARNIVNKLKSSVEVMASADMVSTLETTEKMSVIMDHVEKFNKHTNSSADEFSTIIPKIYEAVSLGVQSLQFEDLTRQSLESLQSNVSRIHSISDVLEGFNQDSTKDVQFQLILLKEKCKKIHQETKESERKRSVKQSCMDEGEVDLF